MKNKKFHNDKITLLVNTHIKVNSIISSGDERLLVKRIVPVENYVNWYAFIMILSGAILPFVVDHRNAIMFFMYLPLGILSWAHSIMTQKKRTDFKYKITCLIL